MNPFGTKSIILYLLLFLSDFAFSQLDTEHWFPPLHSRANNQIEDQYVYLSTPVATPFVVTIKDGAGNILATPTISLGSSYVYSVGTGQLPATQLFVPIDSLNVPLRNRGLVLTASQPFYANERVRSNAQAESFTAKGTAAKGTVFRIGGFPQFTEGTSNADRNFTVGIIATQDNTTVTVSDYDTGVLFAGVPNVSSPTMTVTLQQGECYVLSGYTNTPANLAGIIGALVQSNNPIVLSNGNVLGNIHPTSNSRDMGLDQSVPVNRLGNDYILIEGNGVPEMERPIVIAHTNNTAIYINGSSTPITTIQAGEYYLVPNASYQGTSHRNMYVRTSEPAYVYQALAGSSSQATSGLNFIPPFNCFLPNTINYIPEIQNIGSTSYTGGLMIFTQQGAILQINGVTQTGAIQVPTIPWETYKITGLTGDANITSTGAVAAGVFGASSSAGWAGYYSGFSTNPEASDFTYSDTCINSVTPFTGNYDVNVTADAFSWDFGDPASGGSNTSALQNPTHQFSGPGTYNVQFITHRCKNDTVIKTVTILDLPTPATVGANQTICGTSANLTGNVISIGNGVWSVVSGSGNFQDASAPASSVSGLSVGPNIFQWTSSNGSCPATNEQITITQNPVPTVSDAGTDQTICSNQVQLNGNTPTIGTGTWTLISGSGTIATPNSPTSNVTGLGTGANVFEWTIANSPCASSSSQVTITQNIPPAVSDAGTDQAICSSQVQLNGNVPSIGTGTWTLISGSGTVAAPNSPTSNVTGLGVGANIFQWTIANSPCASNSTQVTITQNAPPTTSNAGTDQTICSSQAQLNGNTPSTGIGAWTLISGSGTITSPNSPTSNVTGLGIGSNVFEWTITNSSCAPSSSQVSITQNPPPTPSVTGVDQVICGDQVQLNGSTPVIGSGVWTLVIGAGNISSPNTPNTLITNLGPGNNVFQWTISNFPCQSSFSQITISHEDLDLTELTNEPDFCNQSNGTASVQVNLTSPVNYLWIPGNLTGDSQTNLTTGDYHVYATDASGCIDSLVVTISAGSAQNVNAGTDLTVCEGTSITLSATGSGNYSWNNGVVDGTSFIAAGNQTYTVQGTDIHGCTSTDQINVTVVPNPDANFTSSATPGYVGEAVIFTNGSTNANSYDWDFGNGETDTTTNLNSVNNTYNSPGVYTVTLDASNDYCTNSASQTITILSFPPPVIEIPNVFTPNGDNVNDFFEITATHSKSIDVIILNRWGNKMVTLDKTSPKWAGEDVSDGVYFFTYTIVGLNGDEVSGQGFVTLRR